MLNDKIKNILAISYEIVIRLLFFFTIGILVTTLLSYDPLTGVWFWSVATDYCYELMLAMMAIVIMGAAFSPEVGATVWKKFYVQVLKLNSGLRGKEKIFKVEDIPKLKLPAFVKLVSQMTEKVKIEEHPNQVEALKLLKQDLAEILSISEYKDPVTGQPMVIGE